MGSSETAQPRGRRRAAAAIAALLLAACGSGDGPEADAEAARSSTTVLYSTSSARFDDVDQLVRASHLVFEATIDDYGEVVPLRALDGAGAPIPNPFASAYVTVTDVVEHSEGATWPPAGSRLGGDQAIAFPVRNERAASDPRVLVPGAEAFRVVDDLPGPGTRGLFFVTASTLGGGTEGLEILLFASIDAGSATFETGAVDGALGGRAVPVDDVVRLAMERTAEIVRDNSTLTGTTDR